MRKCSHTHNHDCGEDASNCWKNGYVRKREKVCKSVGQGGVCVVIATYPVLVKGNVIKVAATVKSVTSISGDLC